MDINPFAQKLKLLLFSNLSICAKFNDVNIVGIITPWFNKFIYFKDTTELGRIWFEFDFEEIKNKHGTVIHFI